MKLSWNSTFPLACSIISFGECDDHNWDTTKTKIRLNERLLRFRISIASSAVHSRTSHSCMTLYLGCVITTSTSIMHPAVVLLSKPSIGSFFCLYPPHFVELSSQLLSTASILGFLKASAVPFTRFKFWIWMKKNHGTNSNLPSRRSNPSVSTFSRCVNLWCQGKNKFARENLWIGA